MYQWRRLVLGALLLVGAAVAQPVQAAPISGDSMNAASAGAMTPVQARWVWVGHHHHRYYRPHRHYRHAYHHRHHLRPYYRHRYYYRRW